MGPTELRVGGVRWVLAELNKINLIHPHGGCQTPHFVLAFAYSQLLTLTTFLPLKTRGQVPILGSDHVSSGLSTRQDINPCDPPEDAPRLPAA